MLTPEERQKIIEEETLRKQVRGYTATDWLSSCIMAPFILIAIGIVVLLAIALFGLLTH